MQDKWDKRYQFSTEPGDCCQILQDFRHLLPQQGRSLDLACGLGANALFLAEQGLESHAWDISPVALGRLEAFSVQRGLSIISQQRDVEKNPPVANSFDVIVVSLFLHRPLCPALIDALKPGGLLFYQTFNKDRLSTHGPNTADYLLGSNELLSLFSSLTVRAYREEGVSGNLQQGLRDMSYLAAQKSVTTVT